MQITKDSCITWQYRKFHSKIIFFGGSIVLLKEVYRVFKISVDIYEVDFGHEDSEIVGEEYCNQKVTMKSLNLSSILCNSMLIALTLFANYFADINIIRYFLTCHIKYYSFNHEKTKSCTLCRMQIAFSDLLALFLTSILFMKKLQYFAL